MHRFGEPSASQFRWSINRGEALQQLDHFVTHALPHFGNFQDAMSRKAWRLFHSLLSFALNVKMLGAREVVNRVEAEWRAGRVQLSAAEGFIRQIIGWREYVRGIYWAQMPGYDQHNYFAHSTPLPEWFWNSNTRMNCLAAAITGSLQHAHAHHIQRLMVIGNFALLAGLDPHALHRWYLGIYIDTYYCKGCAYDKKQRLGESACPFNALYWDFYQRNAAKLQNNPRIGMALRQLARMPPDQLAALQAQARHTRQRLDAL